MSVLLMGIGLDRHWNVSLPLVGTGRILGWLLLGIYSCVPVYVVGAVTVRLIGGRIVGLDRITATAVRWAVGWICVVAVGVITLAAGGYTPLLWQCMAPLAWLGLLGWLVATRWRALRALADMGRRGLQDPFPLLSWRALLGLTVAAAALHASLPPDTRDELSYHLVMPELWAAQGDWWVPLDNFHLAFPGSCELMWGWAGAVAGPLAPRFVTLAFAVLTVALLAGWMAEQATAGWIRDLSLVFLAVTPVALTAASICYVEWPLLFFLFLGWRLSRFSLETPAAVSVWWAAACWGMASSIKYTALLFVGLLAAEWLHAQLTRHAVRSAVTAGLALALAVAALAGPWFARNWIATGDPIFPLGSAIGVATASPHDPEVLAQYADLPEAWRWFPWLYHATVDPVGDHRLHPLWPLLHLAVLVVGWRWRRDLPWFAVVVSTAALAWFNPAARIYLPLMLLVWLFLPRILGALPGGLPDRRLASLAVGLMAVVSLPTALHFMFAPGGTAVPDYLLGVKGRRGYLAERGLIDPTTAWVADNTSPEARVWAWCEDRILYLDRWTRSDSPYGPPSVLRIVERGGAPSLDAELEARPVDYVFVRRDRCPEAWTRAAFEKRSWEIDPEVRGQLTEWSRTHLEEVLRDGRHTLYRVRR